MAKALIDHVLMNKLALEYAETYGIITYRVEGTYIVYNTSYPSYLGAQHYTIQHRVNLITHENFSRRLNHFDRRGYDNV